MRRIHTPPPAHAWNWNPTDFMLCMLQMVKYWYIFCSIYDERHSLIFSGVLFWFKYPRWVLKLYLKFPLPNAHQILSCICGIYLYLPCCFSIFLRFCTKSWTQDYCCNGVITNFLKMLFTSCRQISSTHFIWIRGLNVHRIFCNT